MEELEKEDILKAFLESEELAEFFMNQIKFQKHSLKEWVDHFKVKLPKEMTPEQFRDMFVLLANRIQQVSYFYSIASGVHLTVSEQSDQARAALTTQLVSSYLEKNAKRPAAGVLEQLVNEMMKESIMHMMTTRILREFWKERREALVEVRKCLEQIALSRNMEMKYQEAS